MQKTKSIFLQFICLLSCLNSFEVYAQGGVDVTVNLENATVLDVLKSIEKDTDFAFFFSCEQFHNWWLNKWNQSHI